MHTPVVAPIQALKGLGIPSCSEGDILPFGIWVLDHDILGRGLAELFPSTNLIGRVTLGKGSNEGRSLRFRGAVCTILKVSSEKPFDQACFQGENQDMPIEPVNLTAVIAVIMGISVVLIPITGLTARFALKPVVEALSKVFESRELAESVPIMERRMALMESQMEALEASMNRLEEASSFEAQLRDGSVGDENRLSAP